MDPPHITEFASERYFSKLSQLNGAQEQAPSSSAPAAQTQTQTQTPTSPFILPLRESSLGDGEVGLLRPAEHKRFDRSRLFGFRHKVPLLHSKQTAPTPVIQTLPTYTPPTPKPVVDHTHTR